jgi:PiT family inorganic phosphate transporter
VAASLPFVIIIITVALAFDYINGFHDAANSIATVVSTRVLTPLIAVAWAAVFNFIAFAIMGTRVAKTIGGDLVHLELISADLRLYVLLSGLLGAIIWNLITWYLGLPTSSSHAIIGGYGGAAIAAYGKIAGLLKPAAWIKTIIFIFASPMIGMFLGATLMIIMFWVFRNWAPGRIDKVFRRGQLLSAAAYSLGHGGNDAQKTMGIITAVLVAGGFLSSGPGGVLPQIPLWVVLAAHAAMGLGTLSGGWRIVHTMGSKITKLQPVGGF